MAEMITPSFGLRQGPTQEREGLFVELAGLGAQVVLVEALVLLARDEQILYL